jgi:tetratricopeptide (TPR) repeat protein
MGAARKTPIPFLPEDLTGRQLGRFAIRSKLGAGGMGEVWYAEDTKLHRPVAVKRLSRKLNQDPEARRRILREAQRSCALSSDHIAGVHDVLEENGECFLVMEYVEGQTLRQRLQQPMTLQQFLDIAMQCAEALAAAHEHAIVHCDVKPENIMLTPAGRVKILDFGLAKHLPLSDQSSTLDRTGLFGGTPSYMAPEVLREQLPDTRTDIFSLGVVFYEMLTLQNPFSTSGFLATSERILHATPKAITEINPKVPKGLANIVMKAMAKAPEQRYANGRELLEDLRLFEDGDIPRQVNLLERIRLPQKMKGWLAAVLLLAIVLAGSLAFWWTHHRGAIPERGWVFVTDFETSGDENIPDKGVREGLTIALQQSKYINVFPRSRAYEVLERMKKAGAPRIDESVGREICQRENLQVLLAGTIERRGQVYQVTVRGLDPAQGTLLFAERERFDREDQFFEKADGLATKIRKDLGESLDRIETTSRPLAKVTTTSLAALQLYSRARDAQYSGKEDEVETLLKGALQLDSDFAMAHLRLGQYYSAVIGTNEKALAEVQRAYELRQSVTERERHSIEAHYYHLQERYDEKAQTLNVLVSLYPDDEEAHTELAYAYYDLGILDKAIAEAQQALKLNPFSAPAYGGLVLYLVRQDKPEQAIATAREASLQGVSSARIHWGAGLAFLASGNVADAREEFQRIGGATETQRDLRDLCVVVADLYEGNLNSARAELIKQIGSAAPQSGGLQSFRQYLLGRIYLMQGDRHNAMLQADLILGIPPSRLQGADFFNAGLLYARTRKLAEAHNALRLLAKANSTIQSSYLQNNFRNLEGEIFLAQSAPNRAEIPFSASSPAFSSFISTAGLARTYQLQGRWDLAAEKWQNVLHCKGEILQSGFPLDLPVAHIELARVYRQLNHPDLSRQQYEEALGMWTHADEFTLFREAKSELGSLAFQSSPRD